MKKKAIEERVEGCRMRVRQKRWEEEQARVEEEHRVEEERERRQEAVRK
jgi:hypothetical protein